MSGHVVIIDDEDLFREDLATLLRKEGFVCETAANGESGIGLIEQERPDAVLCDLMMQGMGGLEVVDRLSRSCPEVPVIVVTAFGSMETAVKAFRRGAVDYLLKPVALEDLLLKLRRSMERQQLQRELRYLRRAVSDATSGSRLVGESPAMEQVRQMITRVAEADSPVLITGESGTGKELVARAIHQAGQAHESPFVAVNCASLPRELAESELFGHMRGAFTGATRDKPGLFEVARTGTLFLDEVGDLPLELQPKLLRAIEQQEVTRVGGTRPVATPVRILAATHRNLRQEVETGRFREDLYFRIRVVEIELPPLRERREDIPLLVEHLLQRRQARRPHSIRGVDPAAMRLLMATPWRGNVRELDNVLERAVLMAQGELLGVGDLPSELTGTVRLPRQTDDLKAAVRAYEKQHIRQVLEATGGNREAAARRLGIDPSTLYRRIRDLGI